MCETVLPQSQIDGRESELSLLRHRIDGCLSSRKQALVTESPLAIRCEKSHAMQNRELNPLQPVHNLKPCKRVEGTHQIERFFRAAAGMDVDKQDLRRYYNFVDQKVPDLFLLAQHVAKANDRVRVELRDLPITKGAAGDHSCV